MKTVLSVKEAREILGKDADKMSDEEVESTILILNDIATAALEDARMKKLNEDATKMAELIYDIYQDKKASK